MVTDAILAVVLNRALKTIADFKVKGKGRDAITFGTEHARDQLLAHLVSIDNWSRELTFRELVHSKELQQCFIELDVRLGGNKGRQSRSAENSATTTVENLYRGKGNYVFLGAPGAGKTTSLQNLAGLILRERDDGAPAVPVLVRLRDLRAPYGLFDALLARLGVEATVSGFITVPQAHAAKRRVLVGYLDNISAVVLVDGLDEVQASLRAQVHDELQELLVHAQAARYFVTCRTADYFQPLEGTKQFTVLPLSSPQVKKFVHKWLNDATRENAFLDGLRRSTIAGIETHPLTLALLCAVFEQDGEIPRKRSELYERVIRLLLQSWDERRGIRRTSAYSNFTPARKERFLRSIAFWLTEDGIRGVFKQSDLIRAYQKAHWNFELPADAFQEVAREIESHTGIISQSGFGTYEFFHLTLQEYLCASYLVGAAGSIQHSVPHLPNELAIACTIATEPASYFEYAVERYFDQRDRISDNTDRSFTEIFLARLAEERFAAQPSPSCGWSLLVLLKVLPPESAAAIAAKLAAYPSGLPESVRLALLAGRLHETGTDPRVLPKGHALLRLADPVRRMLLLAPKGVPISDGLRDEFKLTLASSGTGVDPDEEILNKNVT